MGKRKNQNDQVELTVPPTAARAARMALRSLQPAAWANQIVSRRRPAIKAASFGTQLLERFEQPNSVGIYAETFAERFLQEPLETEREEMTLAPYSPAQRQVSAARQGALEWPSGPPTAPLSRGPLLGTPADTSEQTIASEQLLDDLRALGWDTARSQR